MGFFSDLFGRGGRVVRGHANDAVSSLEDANFDSTVRQTIADMKEELNNVVRASAVAMSNYNRLDAEYQKYARQSSDWKARANQALDAGNEELAKKALAKKSESDQQVTAMQSAIDQARQASDNLKNQVMELKRRIDDGERTATTLVARKNAAAAQKKVAEAMAGVAKSDNAFAQLSRFEERVAKEEATAKAFQQLGAATKDQNLEAEFAQLGDHSVDAQLEALKRERALPPPSFPVALPAPQNK
ncbi:MAG TPA: PspA/IM30 family protein [Bryobacteraceae bacterium]|jgi:phage shock protein A|nr:PspA/IM30 family protein [Bryobacteraceae bacterium]